MAGVLQRRRDAMVTDYLAGRDWPEADRRALTLVEEWVEDFFEASAEDIQKEVEQNG